jgi:hypothetical protein
MSSSSPSQEECFREGAWFGNVQVIENYIQANNNNPDALNAVNQDGRTLLMVAAYHGNAGIVDKLVEAKANLDMTDNEGATALILAARSSPNLMDYRSNVLIVAKLVKAGADVNIASSDGNTALMAVIAKYNTRKENKSSTEIAECLIKARGANLNKPDANGNTPLILAINKKLYGAIRLLINKVDIYILNNQSDTAELLLKRAATTDYRLEKLYNRMMGRLQLQDFFDAIKNEISEQEAVQNCVDLLFKAASEATCFLLRHVPNINDFGDFIHNFANLFTILGGGYPEIERKEFEQSSHAVMEIAAIIGNEDAKNIIQNYSDYSNEEKQPHQVQITPVQVFDQSPSNALQPNSNNDQTTVILDITQPAEPAAELKSEEKIAETQLADSARKLKVFFDTIENNANKKYSSEEATQKAVQKCVDLSFKAASESIDFVLRHTHQIENIDASGDFIYHVANLLIILGEHYSETEKKEKFFQSAHAVMKIAATILEHKDAKNATKNFHNHKESLLSQIAAAKVAQTQVVSKPSPSDVLPLDQEDDKQSVAQTQASNPSLSDVLSLDQEDDKQSAEQEITPQQNGSYADNFSIYSPSSRQRKKATQAEDNTEAKRLGRSSTG